MKKFTNQNVLKEQQKTIKCIIIGIILIFISFLFKYLEKNMIKEANENARDLNSIISSEAKENKKSYLNVSSIPYKFAVYDGTTNSYYIVSDGRYLYITYMSEDDFDKLNVEDIYDHSIKVDGITKNITDDIKKLAIKAYNENMEEDKKISIRDFDNYFGSIYLDMTVSDTGVAFIATIFFVLFLFFGGLTVLLGTIQLLNYKKSINKLENNVIKDLDNEMNQQNAIYYTNAHLYLTEHYIINFDRTFNFIKYDDVLWMYPFEQMINGIKISQSIKVLDKTGRTYLISCLAVITKSKKIYSEIWNTIISKNNHILLGYTNENIQAMKEKFKKIKNNK